MTRHRNSQSPAGTNICKYMPRGKTSKNMQKPDQPCWSNPLMERKSQGLDPPKTLTSCSHASTNRLDMAIQQEYHLSIIPLFFPCSMISEWGSNTRLGGAHHLAPHIMDLHGPRSIPGLAAASRLILVGALATYVRNTISHNWPLSTVNIYWFY